VTSEAGVTSVSPRLRAAGLVAAAILVLAACGSTGPTPAGPTYTAVAIGATPWPNGTVGQYGLRIDPTLLHRLPSSVLALPLREDAASEAGALGDVNLPNNFDGYAAASIGIAGSDPDWLNVVIGHLKPAAQTPDFYQAWVSEYATGACSQANGVSSSYQETINDWNVDVATCGGGLTVYTAALGDNLILSMWGMGPKDLGRKLLQSLN
jgi:hypothetical protein